MLKIVAAVSALALAVVLILAALRPPSFHVERSVLIAAAPQAVLEEIEDFRAWRAWSPYETVEPDLQRSYGGAERGVGATYAWSGRKIGAGRMRILSADERQIRIALDFERPMKSSNLAVFTAEPQGEFTRVTWSMNGPSPYLSRLLGLAFDIDSMLGRDFETGLSNLKSVAERT